MIVEVLISLLSVSPVGPAFVTTADLKCPPTHSMPGAPLNSVVVLVDGEIEEVAEMGKSPSGSVVERIEPDSIYGLEIKCWNPDTDELPARDGIPLILITTKAYVEARRAPVEEAVDAVLAFEEEHGRAPTDLEEVEGLDRTADAANGSSATAAEIHGAAVEPHGAVGYGVSDRGWWIGSAGGPLAYRCSAERTATTEPEVTCEPGYELAKENLRERYERGENQAGGA